MNYSPVSQNVSRNLNFSSIETNSNEMESYLYAKKGISMPWEKYYIRLTPSKLIASEDKHTNVIFSINLSKYQLSWHGQSQEIYSFLLKNNGENLREVHWLYVGSDNELIAKNCYHYLLGVMVYFFPLAMISS